MTRLATVETFVQAQDQQLDWLVPGRIPKPAMILVAGGPKAGKTYLIVDIANRLAAGTEVLGTPVVKPCRVLYLTTDARAAIWRNFFSELRDWGVQFHPNFMLVGSEHWHRPANVLSEATQIWTREILAEAQPDVVVLDVLRDFHNGDENDSTSMKMVFDQLERLFKDVCFIIVCHTKKIPKDVTDPDPQNWIRGSSYVMGKVDDLWLLHNGVLKIEGRMGGAALKFTGTRLENGFWTFPAADEIKTKRDQCVALCVEFPGRSHNEIVPIAMERLHLSRATYFRYMKGQACAHSSPTKVHDAVQDVQEVRDSSKENEVLTIASNLSKSLPDSETDFLMEVLGGTEPEVDTEVATETLPLVWQEVHTEVHDEAGVLAVVCAPCQFGSVGGSGNRGEDARSGPNHRPESDRSSTGALEGQPLTSPGIPA